MPKPPAAAAPAQPGVKIGKPYVVFGKTYVPADDRGYDEKGIASWYGPTFHAKATANGEIYNQDDVTAAHKTLPMPSWVEVTNLDNGRQLVLRINDRGPFVDGRIIDLSRKSAQLLGVDQPGLARVRVKRVFPDGDWARSNPPKLVSTPLAPPPPSLPTQTVAAAPVAPVVSAPVQAAVAAPTAGGSYIQVAALSDEGRAKALASVMADFGPAVAQLAPNGMWRVRIGPLDSASADTMLWDVRASGYPDARVVR
ncbi:septal ring lytic transglycosylase RlpA family protein [Sandaracinobacteroides hominis]|uniref:septal ring lytic transglycosylase RlpA family protein n=1 Tax=Sandaracinobacteroides hominis TaxID=2780086 RepID=UPI002E2E02CF|nr:septal ring lytic transglycosylase RlpA family protein [Sandaracinobacteroides hominis]